MVGRVLIVMKEILEPALEVTRLITCDLCAVFYRYQRVGIIKRRSGECLQSATPIEVTDAIRRRRVCLLTAAGTDPEKGFSHDVGAGSAAEHGVADWMKLKVVD